MVKVVMGFLLRMKVLMVKLFKVLVQVLLLQQKLFMLKILAVES
jgi:hypothetical protein